MTLTIPIAEHFLRGDVGVDVAASRWETMMVNGKARIYFGSFPAFARMPLNYLYPAGRGAWSRFLWILRGNCRAGGFCRTPPHGVAIVCTINSLAEMDGRRVFGGFRFWFSSSVFCRKPDYLQRSNPVGICLVCGLSLFRFAIPRVRGRSIDVVAACLFILRRRSSTFPSDVRRALPPDCGSLWNSIVPEAIHPQSCGALAAARGCALVFTSLLRMPNSAISAGCPWPIRSIRISVILL